MEKSQILPQILPKNYLLLVKKLPEMFQMSIGMITNKNKTILEKKIFSIFLDFENLHVLPPVVNFDFENYCIRQ